jgi:hypothetical protein
MLVGFLTVLVVEDVGDKSIYCITSLSLRFRTGAAFTGITVAFMSKMLAAVLLAKAFVQLHFRKDLLVAGAFFLSAYLHWFEEPELTSAEHPASAGWCAAVICFASLFLTEWGAPGQVVGTVGRYLEYQDSEMPASAKPVRCLLSTRHPTRRLIPERQPSHPNGHSKMAFLAIVNTH